MTNKKYCYREPDFPKSAYLGIMFVGDIDQSKFIQTLTKIYPTIKSLQSAIKKLKKDLFKLKDGPVYVNGVVIVKVNFNKKFPLKKEYWDSTDIVPLDEIFRLKEYMKMMDDVHQFYNILILPAYYEAKKKKWNYINWVPILITTDDKKLDELVRMSDQPVDPSAKNMGIYSIEYIKGFDLDTGKFVKSQKEIDLEGANC